MGPFHGRYENKIDSKGKLLLPENFIEILRSNNCEELCLVPHPDFCIMVFEKHLDFENAEEDLRFVIKAERWVCKVDADGYLIVPQALRSYAEIIGDVIIIGFGLRFEIWALEKWDQFDNHLRSMFNFAIPEDIVLNSDLARKLLSDNPKKPISIKRWNKIKCALRETSKGFHKKFPERRTLKDFLKEFNRDNPHTFVANTSQYVLELKQYILTSTLKERELLIKILDMLEHRNLLQSTEVGKVEYARIWTNQSKPEGETISEQKFDELVKNKEVFKIFVIDRGEEKIGSVGEVYLNNKPVFQQPEKDKVVGSKKDKKKEIKKYLTPIEYSLLVRTLKNQGKAGDVFTLIKECWRRPDFAKLLQGDWNEIEKGRGDVNKFRRDTSGHRKTIGALSSFLNDKIGIKLRTFGKVVYRFSMQVKFCFIEVS